MSSSTESLADPRSQPHAGRTPPRPKPAAGRAAKRNTFAGRAVFSVGGAAADAAVMLLSGLFAGLAYQRDFDDINDTMKPTLVIAALFVGINILRGDYEISRYFALKGHAERVLTAWLAAFGAALSIGFLTKASAIFSRGAIAIFFLLGYVALMAARGALVRRLQARARSGRLTSRTVGLVGTEEQISLFLTRHDPTAFGQRIVVASVLRDTGEHLKEDLALALATARIRRPDDVFVLLSWSDVDAIRSCIDAFRRLPAGIHLGTLGLFDTFKDVRVDHLGPIASVHLVRSPLSPFEVTGKRIFDIVFAAAILAVLAPLLLLVGLAIKLESRGPVLFRQRRYGFNQEPFRILKFRSMTTMEDGANLTQVTVGDKRVTRVGGILRRTSIDELPQLINVLKGDMSLVGPRPHALAHDQKFERMIALYARRHNVRPGITGWAQVNGWRGETDTSEKIRGRVEHDLYYIDNWSFWLDISILARTALSPRTFRNAK